MCFLEGLGEHHHPCSNGTLCCENAAPARVVDELPRPRGARPRSTGRAARAENAAHVALVARPAVARVAVVRVELERGVAAVERGRARVGVLRRARSRGNRLAFGGRGPCAAKTGRLRRLRRRRRLVLVLRRRGGAAGKRLLPRRALFSGRRAKISQRRHKKRHAPWEGGAPK